MQPVAPRSALEMRVRGKVSACALAVFVVCGCREVSRRSHYNTNDDEQSRTTLGNSVVDSPLSARLPPPPSSLGVACFFTFTCSPPTPVIRGEHVAVQLAALRVG